MPYVKVPGVDREVWVDLHEPLQSGLPWFAEVGTAETVTPEKFAAEIASGGFVETVVVLTSSSLTRNQIAQRIASANQYETARRKILGGRTGAPRTVSSFRVGEDFALMVLYFESKGHKQAVRAVAKHWKESGQNVPTRRAIFAALQLVRTWLIPDLFAVVEVARKRRLLKPAPTATHKPKRPMTRAN